MAEKRLNRLQDEDVKTINIHNAFSGVKKIYKTVPTFGK